MGEKIDTYLQSLWEAMQDSYPDNALMFKGALNMALFIGLITQEKHELWNLRIKNCPNPDHIGGRVWCAYCGDIKRDENEHVYCTDCKWFRLDDEELPYCVYEDTCNINNCEDSRPFKERPQYDPITLK